MKDLQRPKSMNRSLMWSHPLVPEVTLVLIVKVVLILAAALFIFSPSQRPKINPSGMAARLMGTAPSLDSTGLERDGGAKPFHTLAHPSIVQPRSFQP